MDSQAEIEALDDAWNEGYRRKDVTLLASVLAEDWTGFLPGGRQVGKAELLAGVPSNPDVELGFARHDVLVFGEAAVTRGSLSADGKHVQSFLLVYAWRGGQWQAVSVQVVP